MPIYMKYDGVSGGSGSQGYIEIYSFSWGMSQASTYPAAASGNEAKAGSVSFGDLTIGKGTGSHRVVLRKQIDGLAILFGGKKFDTSIVFTAATPSGPRHTLTLKGAVVTGIRPHHPHGPDGGALTAYEELTLTFSDYEFNGIRDFSPQMISSMTAFAGGVP